MTEPLSLPEAFLFWWCRRCGTWTVVDDSDLCQHCQIEMQGFRGLVERCGRCARAVIRCPARCVRLCGRRISYRVRGQ